MSNQELHNYCRIAWIKMEKTLHTMGSHSWMAEFAEHLNNEIKEQYSLLSKNIEDRSHLISFGDDEDL